MSPDLLIPLAAIFLSVALASGALASLAFSRRAPGRRRLRDLDRSHVSTPALANPQLAELPNPAVQRLASIVPKSPKDMVRMQRRLTAAGYQSFGAAVAYSLAELLLPIIFGGLSIWVLGVRRGWVVALFAAALAFMAPAFWLARATEKRKRQIRNGLPDALDLILLCLEAGSSIDQAIVKATNELAISHRALAEELRLVTTEARAGKPRLEAFRNFADRTKVDEVRAFVAMLIQTDRFGTSLGQALRTHAEVSRTKRRQRAEERAGKLGVKMVFPLVFCLFPAFYVVVLGPVVIKFIRVFFTQF